MHEVENELSHRIYTTEHIGSQTKHGVPAGPRVFGRVNGNLDNKLAAVFLVAVRVLDNEWAQTVLHKLTIPKFHIQFFLRVVLFYRNMFRLINKEPSSF